MSRSDVKSSPRARSSRRRNLEGSPRRGRNDESNMISIPSFLIASIDGHGITHAIKPVDDKPPSFITQINGLKCFESRPEFCEYNARSVVSNIRERNPIRHSKLNLPKSPKKRSLNKTPGSPDCTRNAKPQHPETFVAIATTPTGRRSNATISNNMRAETGDRYRTVPFTQPPQNPLGFVRRFLLHIFTIERAKPMQPA